MKNISHTTGRPPLFYGWYIVAGHWMILFLSNATAVSIFFPPMLEEFGWDRATLSLVHTGALMLLAVANPFLGRLIDRFGPRVMTFILIGGQAASNAVNGLAQGMPALFAGRFLYDIKPMQAGHVLINRWFLRKRGRAQGIAASGFPVGAFLLSPLSQYLVLAWGWRETMFFWAGITIIVLLPMAFIMRNYPEERGTGPDGDPLSATPPQAGITNLAPVSAAGAGHSLSQAARSLSFWLVAGTQVFCGIGCGFLMTHIIIFTTDFGYSAMVGATLISVMGALNLVGLLVTGHLSDRFNRGRMLAVTHVIRTVAFLIGLVFILAGGQPLWILYAMMVLFGFGWFTTAPLTTGLVADIFGNRSMGTIIGIVMSCHTIGTAIGAYAGGLSFDLTGSYRPVFIAQVAMELAAAIMAYIVSRRAFRST